MNKVIIKINILAVLFTLILAGCSSTEKKYLTLQKNYDEITYNFKVDTIKSKIEKKGTYNYLFKLKTKEIRQTSWPQGTGVYIADEVISNIDIKLYKLNDKYFFTNSTYNKKSIYSNTTKKESAITKSWYLTNYGLVTNRLNLSYTNILYSIINKKSIKQGEQIVINDFWNLAKIYLNINGITKINNKEYIVATISSDFKTREPKNRYYPFIDKYYHKFTGYILFDKKTFLPYYANYNVLSTHKALKNRAFLINFQSNISNIQIDKSNYPIKTYTGIIDTTHCKNGQKNEYIIKTDGNMVFGEIANSNISIVGRIKDSFYKSNEKTFSISAIKKENEQYKRVFFQDGNIEINDTQIKGNFTNKCKGEFTFNLKN